ncbi:hypothetical protein IT575_09590 [bacterium]|nr:hypothetical protein [bacterium]
MSNHTPNTNSVSARPRRASFSSAGAGLALLLLLSAGCGADNGGGLDAAPQPEALPAGLSAGLPALPPSGRAASQTALVVPGAESFDASAGAEVQGTKMRLDSAEQSGGGLAWAVYEFSTTDLARYPVELRVDVSDDSGEYWLALSDYTSVAWKLSGPYQGMATLPAPADIAVVSPSGRAYVAVLDVPPGAGGSVTVVELELKLSRNPAPPAPTGLEAAVLPGSVMLSWNASSAPGLIGYNVYYSTAPFELTEQGAVNRANDMLVPKAVDPQYEVLELALDQTYYFRIAAVVADQAESALSNQATATTSYSLLVEELFPPRQYPGFWVYASGLGFNPAPGGTRVYWNDAELDAGEVQDVGGKGLRIRVPADAATEEVNEVKIKVGSQFSNSFELVTVDPATPPKNWAHLGKTLYQNYEMYTPAAVASDSAGNMYVGQLDAGRIDVYQPGGQPLREFWFGKASDLEVVDDGRILIRHAEGPEVYFLDQSDGSLSEPISADELAENFVEGAYLAASGDGEVIYLSDADTGVIRKFVGGVHDLDIGAGQLEHPQDVELDSQGNLVVVDDSADSVFWFEPDGSFIGSYDGSANLDPDTGELRGPCGLAVQPDGTVLVTDRERDRVVCIMSASRTCAGEWGESGYSDGAGTLQPGGLGDEARFWSPRGIAPLSGGRVLVADEHNCRAGAYDQDSGVLELGLMDYSSPVGEYVNPQSFAVRESDGAFAVVDSTTYSVTLLDRRNQVLDFAYLETGLDGDALSGRLDRTPREICWSADKLYLTHNFSNLTEYSADLESYRVLAVDKGSGPGQFKGDYGMAADGDTLYVGDRDNDRVQVFVDGEYERSIPMPNPAGNSLGALALDKDNGYLYVLDNPNAGTSQILRMDAATGAFLDSHSFGFAVGSVLACDPAGFVYVYYFSPQGLLHKYRPSDAPGGDWELVCDFALSGDGDGELRSVGGLSISADGRFMIGDRVRRQVVILAP